MLANKKLEQITPATWIKVAWDNSERDGIVIANDQADAEIEFLETDGEVHFIDYNQVIKIGNQVSTKDTGLDS